MSDPLQPHTIVVDHCSPDCMCQAVHLVFLDPDGQAFSAAHMTSEMARNIARDLNLMADIADAQRAKIDGRVQ